MTARTRAVAKAGGNGFMSVSATHAAVRLAQGAGRLIRATEDKGVVADPGHRLANARYGSFLRAALPPFWSTTDRATGGIRGDLGSVWRQANPPVGVEGAHHRDDLTHDGGLVAEDRLVLGVLRQQPRVAVALPERLHRRLVVQERGHDVTVLGLCCRRTTTQSPSQIAASIIESP